MSWTIPIGRQITLTLSWDDLPPAEVDRDWQTASGTLGVALRPTDGQFDAIRDVEVGAETLVRFDEALSRLLDELNGTATFEPWVDLEGLGDFALTVTLEHGKGWLSGFLATSVHKARLAFDRVEIDQTHLAETQRLLRLLLDRRPG